MRSINSQFVRCLVIQFLLWGHTINVSLATIAVPGLVIDLFEVFLQSIITIRTLLTHIIGHLNWKSQFSMGEASMPSFSRVSSASALIYWAVERMQRFYLRLKNWCQLVMFIFGLASTHLFKKSLFQIWLENAILFHFLQTRPRLTAWLGVSAASSKM